MKRFAGIKRVRNAGGPADSGGWPIIYTGFVMILLCFFVLLTSYASLEPSRITPFVRSFSNAVSVFAGGDSLEQGQAVQSARLALLHREDQLAQLFDRVMRVSTLVDLDQFAIEKTDQGIVMSFSDRFLFESGKAEFSDEGGRRLAKIGELVLIIAAPVEIEGHTDDRPIGTRRFPSNWELSTARAVGVLRELVERQGINPQLLTAVGYGPFRPVAPNDSALNRARNRRVDIVFKVP